MWNVAANTKATGLSLIYKTCNQYDQD
jgi:hypothetical protein